MQKKRGRPLRTTPRPGVEKLPLNAQVDQQLLLAFNDFSQDENSWRGTRDELVEFVFKAFLDSPRKPPRRAERKSEGEEFEAVVAATVGGVRRAVDVIAQARRHAEAIVQVTTMAPEPDDLDV